MPSPIRAVIAADSPPVVEAGARIAREGGSAVDVAVAAAFVASLVEILFCSLAGSAFVMVGRPGAEPELIDGADAVPGLDPNRPADPARANTREVVLTFGGGVMIQAGHGTVAVPGMPAALELAWQRHGRLPWAEVLAPAVALAHSGWPMGRTLSEWLGQVGPGPYSYQEESRRCFFPDGDRPPAPGQPFRIPDMDRTLALISREGTRAFYEGDLAAAIAREMDEHGGLLARADLAAYRAEVHRPLRLRSAGWTLALNPPPAVGGAALGILIGWLERAWVPGTSPAERALLHARAQAALLGLRTGVLDTPDFDDAIARSLLDETGLRRWLPRLGLPGTTSIAVAAADGTIAVVAMSNGYDAGVTIPGTGIACNNALGEPELNPRGYLALPAGARLPSNMTPTFAVSEDGRRLGLSTPGAARISTALAQCWARLVFEGLSPADAIAAPRLHVGPGTDGRLIAYTEPGIDASLLPPAFEVTPFDRRDMFFGGVKLASIDADGSLYGVADDRRQGAVVVVNPADDIGAG
jgi:gamma-glutamyltranspeptidase/glutathione hydrolase